MERTWYHWSLMSAARVTVCACGSESGLGDEALYPFSLTSLAHVLSIVVSEYGMGDEFAKMLANASLSEGIVAVIEQLILRQNRLHDHSIKKVIRCRGRGHFAWFSVRVRPLLWNVSPGSIVRRHHIVVITTIPSPTSSLLQSPWVLKVVSLPLSSTRCWRLSRWRSVRW
jgi:hypothetical protein